MEIPLDHLPVFDSPSFDIDPFTSEGNKVSQITSK